MLMRVFPRSGILPAGVLFSNDTLAEYDGGVIFHSFLGPTFGGRGEGEGFTAAQVSAMRYGPELDSSMVVSSSKSGARVEP